MSELKPCPFCGGEANYGYSPDGNFVCCVDCAASTNVLTGHKGDNEFAKSLWNTRTVKRRGRGILFRDLTATRIDTSAKVDVESAGDFVTRLGMDGRLWAKEMHAMFPQIPEEDLLGWCCNMIMAGYDNARGTPINGDHAQYLLDKAAIQPPRSDTSAVELTEALKDARETLKRIKPATSRDRALIYTAVRHINQVLDPIETAEQWLKNRGDA
jgi:hypothetical protein